MDVQAVAEVTARLGAIPLGLFEMGDSDSLGSYQHFQTDLGGAGKSEKSPSRIAWKTIDSGRNNQLGRP